MQQAGSRPARLLAIGGGARSDVWLRLLADALALALDRPAGAEVGPALGAARLALLSLGLGRGAVVMPPAIAQAVEPKLRQAAGPANLAGPLPRRLRAAACAVLTPQPCRDTHHEHTVYGDIAAVRCKGPQPSHPLALR